MISRNEVQLLRLRNPFRGRNFWPLTQVYNAARLEPAVRRSLNFMLVSNIMGTLFGIICGSGTNAMIGLANYLGAGDLDFGILNAIPQIAMFLQIPCAMLVGYTRQRKKYLLTFGLISRALWMLFGLVPFIVPTSPAGLQMFTILALLGLSSAMGSFIGVCWMPWLADLAPIRIRGSWMSMRDTLNSIVTIVGGLIIAHLLDTLPGMTKYTILFLIGGFFGVMDMVFFGFCKEVYSAPPQKPSLIKMGKDIWENKKFFRFTIFWAVWCFTANFGGAYVNRYSINEMGLTYMQITIFSSIAASLVSILVIRYWGRIMDTYGVKPVLWISGIGAALTQAFYMFSTPGSVLPVLLHNALGAMFWSATNLVCNNIQLSYSSDENRAGSIAVFGCITALAGTFLGVMAGGSALEMLQNVTITGFWDRYKIVILTGVILRFISVLIFVPGIENNTEYNVKTMFADMKKQFLFQRELRAQNAAQRAARKAALREFRKNQP